MLQRLVEILEEKSAVVTQDTAYWRHIQTGMSARQVAQFWFLHAINSSLTPLRHILLAKHRHPEEMFRECRGWRERSAPSVSTVARVRCPRTTIMIRGQALTTIEEHIIRHLEIIAPSQAIVIPLKPAARYFYEGEIKDQCCLGCSAGYSGCDLQWERRT